MNSSWDRNDPQALLAFLYDLICNVKRPEEVELLVEAVLNSNNLTACPDQPFLLLSRSTALQSICRAARDSARFPDAGATSSPQPFSLYPPTSRKYDTF